MFENSQEKVAFFIQFAYRMAHAPLRLSLLEAPKPAPSIPCHNAHDL